MKNMKLTGQQRKQLQEALIDAFPTTVSLARMLDNELDKNLEKIAGEGNLQDVVFKLIKTTEAEGWVTKLISAAYKTNPGNEQLDKFVIERLDSSLDNTLANNSKKEKYLTIGSLGKGMYTEVYLVKNDLDKELICKELHNTKIKDKFTKAIKNAFEISDIPNFITIYDFDVSTEKPYYVMQYIKGGESLRDYFKQNIRFSFKDAINIVLIIGYAMIKAREKEESPYYLNIKPSNIIIDKKREPFISAFNLCVTLAQEEIFSELQQLFHKDKERFKEELAYLLPEKFNRKGVTEQADQYMLGLLAYELITRKIPPSIQDINNSNYQESLDKISSGEAFQKISFQNNDVDPEYPDEIKDIIMKMTDLDPGKRFKDLKEALDTIEVYSRFTDTRKTIRIVKESFIQCMNNKNFPSFFERFYNEFRRKPGVNEKFSNKDKAFWEKHHKLVEKAILLFIWYYEEKNIFVSINTLTDEKFNFLDSIVEPHIQLNISEELFDFFKKTLIDSIIEYDVKCHEETYKTLIKSAWEKVLAPGFEYIKSQYQSKKDALTK